MKVKLRTKIFRITMLILFAILMTIFISNKNGYYEYQKHEQVTLTEEQIKKFEEDVKNGINIDLENYLKDTTKDYQTKLSQVGLNVSNTLANTVKKGFDNFFKYIGKLVTE